MKTALLLLAFAIYFCAPCETQAQVNTPSKISSYAPVANRIIESAKNGNDSYLKLQELCDDIGHRLSGSAALDKAIAWAQDSLKKDGQENVQAEAVTIRKWTRGEESCELLEPRPMKINMLGLGWSVGTPPEGITAEVIERYTHTKRVPEMRSHETRGRTADGASQQGWQCHNSEGNEG